jgi:hypothetical protein
MLTESQRNAQRRYRERHREELLAKQRIRDAAKKAAKRARWYARHGDAYNERRRAKYAADPEPVLTINHASYARHRKKRVAYARAYRRKLKERGYARM